MTKPLLTRLRTAGTSQGNLCQEDFRAKGDGGLTLKTTSVTTHAMRQWIHRRLDLSLTFDIVSCAKRQDS